MTKQELHQSYVNYINLTHTMSLKDERFKFEDIMSLEEYRLLGEAMKKDTVGVLNEIAEIAQDQGFSLSELILTVKPEFDKIVEGQ